MSTATELAWALGGGLAIGAGFSGLLWLNLRNLGARTHPGTWLLLGAGLRVALVLLGLHWLTHWQPLPVVCALAGFILARSVLTRGLAGRGVNVGERPA